MEIVTGIPCGARSAISCTALCHSAAARAPVRWCTLKCVRCLSSTTSDVGDLLIRPGSSSTEPSAPASMTVWNISPIFSDRLILATRSATRSATGRRGSSKGSMTPLPLRSR